jgi:ferredoxin
MIPSRVAYWNIAGHLWLYALFVPFLVLFLHGFIRLGRLIWAGQPDHRIPPLRQQVGNLWAQALLQQRLLAQPFAGSVHVAISWGFGVLFLATCLIALQDYVGIPVLSGKFYLYFMSLAVDMFGILAMIGVSVALVRRYGMRPQRLWEPRNCEGYGAFLGLLLAILVTGYLVEGLRIQATADPWGEWSPGGWLVGFVLRRLPHTTQLWWYRLLWWGHAALAFAFITLIPRTLIRHILAALANVAFGRASSSGVMLPVKLEAAEHFGVSTIGGLPRKDLLDLIACTECGRCQDVCPAWITRKPLTPKGLILDLRDYLFAGGSGRSMVGEVISEEVLWSCTTYGACQHACPVGIEPLPKILDMRRYLVMEEARFPGTMQAALRSLETRGHPYLGVLPSRTAWTEGLTVPLLADKGTAEYLYWVGCAGAFDERAQRVARAFVQILEAAGVDFAILGEEERCTGDPARRMGQEFLFQMQAQANIETFARYGVQKILTTCPHCFNTLQNGMGSSEESTKSGITRYLSWTSSSRGESGWRVPWSSAWRIMIPVT